MIAVCRFSCPSLEKHHETAGFQSAPAFFGVGDAALADGYPLANIESRIVRTGEGEVVIESTIDCRVSGRLLRFPCPDQSGNLHHASRDDQCVNQTPARTQSTMEKGIGKGLGRHCQGAEKD